MRDLAHESNENDIDRDDAAGVGVLERAYPAVPTTIDRATRAVLARALEGGVGPACRARIGGALAEVLDNALRRAYPCGGGAVRVRARFEGREFVVDVRDQGVGFDTSTLDTELLSTPLHSGLARASSLCETLRIESRPDEGTHVELRFLPGSVAFGDGGLLDLSDEDFLAPDVARRVLHALRRPETAHLHQLSPALAVVVGRLLAGPDPRLGAERALWS